MLYTSFTDVDAFKRAGSDGGGVVARILWLMLGRASMIVSADQVLWNNDCGLMTSELYYSGKPMVARALSYSWTEEEALLLTSKLSLFPRYRTDQLVSNFTSLRLRALLTTLTVPTFCCFQSAQPCHLIGEIFKMQDTGMSRGEQQLSLLISLPSPLIGHKAFLVSSIRFTEWWPSFRFKRLNLKVAPSETAPSHSRPPNPAPPKASQGS